MQSNAIPSQATAPEDALMKPPAPEVVRVTPELATKWLDLNTNNRVLRTGSAEGFARDMIADKWHYTGEPIHFVSEDGRLGNGQHRLRAVEISGKSQWFAVLTLPQVALDCVDAGTRRKLADKLKMAERTVSPTQLSVARRLTVHAAGYAPIATGRYKPTDAEVTRTLDENLELINRAAQVGTGVARNMPITAGVVAIAYALCARIDKSDAETFYARQLWELSGLEYADPASALMRRMKSHRAASGHKMKDWTQYNYIIHAWNHFRRHNKLTKLTEPRTWGPNGYTVPE